MSTPENSPAQNPPPVAMPIVDAGRESAIAAVSLPGLRIKRLAGRWWSDHWITPVLGYAVDVPEPPSVLHVSGWNPEMPEFASNRLLVRVQGVSYQSPVLAPGEMFALDIPLDLAQIHFDITIATLNQLDASPDDQRQRGCHLYVIRLS